MQSQIKKNPTDPYWIHVGLVLQQLQGLSDGYNAVAPSNQKLSLMELTLLNMDGDLDELVVALGKRTWVHVMCIFV